MLHDEPIVRNIMDQIISTWCKGIDGGKSR